MSEDNFKFPPGIRSAEEWAAGQSFCQSDVVAIQRDAVMAARREVLKEWDEVERKWQRNNNYV